MYVPRFLVTQAKYDAALPAERSRYNYVVVEDGPIPLPAHICCMLSNEQEGAENRMSGVSRGIFRIATSINQDGSRIISTELCISLL